MGTDCWGEGVWVQICYTLLSLGSCPDLPHLGFCIFEEFIGLSFEFFWVLGFIWGAYCVGVVGIGGVRMRLMVGMV